MAEAKDTQEQVVARDEKLHRRLEFYHSLYLDGAPLEEEFLQQLYKHGYLQDPNKNIGPKKPVQRKPVVITDTKTEGEKRADESVDIVQDQEMFESDDDVIVMNKKVYSDAKDDKRFLYDGGASISKADWKPKSVIYHDDAFVKWIDSINSGFQNMVPYKPFQMYCQQSADWMADEDNIYQYETIDQRREYAWSEIERIRENSLYFLDKYLHVKEATFDEGFMDYQSKPVHKVMAFLFDCGYSVEMGKPRQIAATTTLGGLAVCKLVTTKNFFIKMIAQDKDKVEEIFDDKIKYPFSDLPEWMHHEVVNDRDNILALGKKSKKGKKEGVNSRMQVVAPSVSAINGGAPPLVLIDEGGYIGILGKMIKEARPTMFMEDPVTKTITMKRQIWIWGTGGEMDKKGKAYEEEYMNTLKKWQNREFEYGIIPIFFDWTTRPGITKEHYLREKQSYTVDGPDSEEKMVQFRQTYPSIVEDMFLTSAKTLVSIAYINKRLETIRSLPHELRGETGYFEPIYDTSSPSKEHDDLPYKVIGAEFVPVPKGDPRASAKIFLHPKKDWEYRNFQGTDPIMTDNGFSNMASSVWDAYYGTLAGIVNYRDSNHKYTFLQIMLLGIYYDPAMVNRKKGLPELVESNIGTAYIDYKDYKGFYSSLIHRSELPPQFQGGGAEIGIDNRASRTKFIIHHLHQLIEVYGDRIYIEEFWEQLRTFVCKVTDKGNETWETQDKRKYFDDVLFSTVFSYICSMCFAHRPPRSMKHKEAKVKTKYRTITRSDGTLSRVEIRKPA